MPDININGIPVKFPFPEPYVPQINYMSKVIESLKTSKNAVLESPTGTGKTLSLLCATLGWVENEKQMQQRCDEIDEADGASLSAMFEDENGACCDLNQIPLIIYASRTHSQLKQAMDELKRSEYKYVKAGLIASREQLCIHPKLTGKTNADKMTMCRSLVQKKKCEYKERLDSPLIYPILKSHENQILDIEELGNIGNKYKCCPYYLSKEMNKKPEIIFMPYNYLLDPKIRNANQIDLKNAVVIFDEAHNVEKVCEQSASTFITSTQIDTAIGNIDHAINKLNESGSRDIPIEIVRRLHTTIKALKEYFDDLTLTRTPINPTGSTTHPGDFIHSILKTVDIDDENVNCTIE
ncbi:regulator of telomere elongation helicase 1 homolog [Contarinia nasturtii]|uniref:regulator of telomere elongation helicase 1 homolog n=1 Tax=Contarinia nasturtii TaxID=265458 RepID=UPI0012D3AE31|nr:regulator of telomere elongation helicase 1 homolog [Contarinia nasturtii]